jgi:flagellar biogenesis protein FliO
MKANEKTAAGKSAATNTAMAVGGLAGWLLNRFRSGGRRQPQLALLERITLAPRQSLALVEAEGRRFLVATSPEGAPAFYALDERVRPNGARPAASRQQSAIRLAERVSW